MTGLDESLVKITKGAGIAFIGSLAGLFLGFLGKLLVVRYGTEAEYGVFSLAFALLTICVLIGTLGLEQGTVRSIAYARGKNEGERVRGIISASLWLALMAGLIVCFILFLTSGAIAEGIFHEPALSLPLKIFATAVPFLILINVFVSIFRGFDRMEPTVYFRDILRGALFPLLLLGIIFLSLPFQWVFYAYLGSVIICCIALIIYAIKRLPSPIRVATNVSANPLAKELLVFSLPLFGAGMLGMIIAWTDTLMLGYFKIPADVGLYNAAQPLAWFISAPLGVMVLIYMPVTSGLYAQGSISGMRRNFFILTKWLCSATLPLFLILFLFPETALSFLFGVNYTSAANALRILSLGFMINNLLGPNGATLIAMGKSRFMMWATLVTAVLNVGLNIALIPPLGIEGAAIASVAAQTSVNLIRCGKLYSLSKAQPLSKNLLKPTITSLVLIFLMQFIFGDFVTVVWWMLPLLLISYYGIYGLSVLLTKSIDREEIAMLLAVEKRTGINAFLIKRILRRYL